LTAPQAGDKGRYRETGVLETAEKKALLALSNQFFGQSVEGVSPWMWRK